MPDPSPLTIRFIGHLENLAHRQDRGALAALRRGLSASPGYTPETYPYVIPWLPNERSLVMEEAFFLVAALFALHPESRKPTDGRRANFGESFAALRQKSGSMEKRFVALLASPWEDLPEHLRHAVALLKAETVSIDYSQLLQDLIRWNAESRFVQRAWARSFWHETVPPQPAGEADSNPQPQTTKD